MVAQWIITHVIAGLSSSSESNPKAANGYCFNTIFPSIPTSKPLR